MHRRRLFCRMLDDTKRCDVDVERLLHIGQCLQHKLDNAVSMSALSPPVFRTYLFSKKC